MRHGGATSRELWDLLNSTDNIKKFKEKWAKYVEKANFIQMLEAYEHVAGLVEADADTAAKLERVIFLPADMSRDEWIAKYSPSQASTERADA